MSQCYLVLFPEQHESWIFLFVIFWVKELGLPKDRQERWQCKWACLTFLFQIKTTCLEVHTQSLQETTILNNNYERLSFMASIWKDPYVILFVRLSNRQYLAIYIINSVLKHFSCLQKLRHVRLSIAIVASKFTLLVETPKQNQSHAWQFGNVWQNIILFINSMRVVPDGGNSLYWDYSKPASIQTFGLLGNYIWFCCVNMLSFHKRDLNSSWQRWETYVNSSIILIAKLSSFWIDFQKRLLPQGS